MIDLKTLPEPQFVTVNWEQQYKELVDSYEQIVGIPLTKGQVESLVLSTFNYRENILRLAINDAAKQNLLAYAKEPVLDHLGARMGVQRLQATAAITTLRFTFSEPLTVALLIPTGTRVNSKDGKAIFADDPVTRKLFTLSTDGFATPPPTPPPDNPDTPAN